MHTEPFSLAVATPTHYGTMASPYVVGLCELQAHCFKQDIGFELLLQEGVSAIDHARNFLANRFLNETHASHLLFIDDDMGFNVEELAAMFEWRNREVVAAMCPKRRIDWTRIKAIVQAYPDIAPAALDNLAGDYTGMFKLSGDAQTMKIGAEPLRVDAIGTGIMLISRDCLVHLIDAAALPTASDEGADYPIYSFFRSTAVGGRLQGEDYHFCDLVNRHGGTVWGCPWLTVTHSGTHRFVGDLKGIARYAV